MVLLLGALDFLTLPIIWCFEPGRVSENVSASVLSECAEEPTQTDQLETAYVNASSSG
jgi:hypothetical protein